MFNRISVALGVLALCSRATAATPDDITYVKLHVATGAGTDSVESWQPCTSCEWTVRSIQDFIANPKHQEQLAEALDSVACNFVPDDEKDACDSRVEARVKHAVRLFEDYVSPSTLCKPVCPDDAMNSQAPSLPHGRYPECSQCKYVASELANSDGVDVGDHAMCSKLPAAFMADCLNFVNSSGGQILQQFVEANGPEYACVEAAHCEIPEIGPALSSVPVPDDIKTVAANLASRFGAVQAKSVMVNDKETCQFCELAVLEVRDKISDPQFQVEVETYAKSVCKNFGDYQNMCIQDIDEYGPIVFALLEDYLDPKTVCGLVHLCPPPH